MHTRKIIRAGRERLGLTEQQFAERVGVSRGAVQQWEKGLTAPKRANQGAVAALLGISVAELMGLAALQVVDSHGNETSIYAYMDSAITENTPKSISISEYSGDGMLGRALVLRDQPGVIERMVVSEEWLQKNTKSYSAEKNLALVTGFGDSMMPLFHPGDPLLVDTGVRSVDHDGIYFFAVAGEGFVKRLQRIPDEGIVAISENKAYREWTIKPHMDFKVFGRVIKAWRGGDY